VPDTAAFTPANNDWALQFALRAIQAQPSAYLRVVAHDSLQPFIGTNDLRFPADQPSTATLDPGDWPYAIAVVTAYIGTTQSLADDLGYRFGTRLRSPFVTIMNEYQHVIFLPGPVLALAMLAGLADCLDAQPAFSAGGVPLGLRSDLDDPPGSRARVHPPVRRPRCSARVHSSRARPPPPPSLGPARPPHSDISGRAPSDSERAGVGTQATAARPGPASHLPPSGHN
jgi:hypothetical protein